jgi:hypothetical protein
VGVLRVYVESLLFIKAKIMAPPIPFMSEVFTLLSTESVVFAGGVNLSLDGSGGTTTFSFYNNVKKPLCNAKKPLS